MNNKIYCSTGCLIGRANGYDWRLVAKYSKEISSDAFELMMLKAYYGQEREISDEFIKAGLSFPVLHTDKDIGTLISRGEDGDLEEALRLFDENCKFASMLSSKLLVLHLWGGHDSDLHFERNVSACPALLEIAGNYGLTIAVENIPCASAVSGVAEGEEGADPKTANPLSHWDTLESRFPELRFIFDTRFGAFHHQLDEYADSKRIESGKVVHMHVSDFTGPSLDFTTLRPILHPHEGIIDFEKFFSSVAKRYNGSITLESPVIDASGNLNLSKLNQTLDYIRKNFTRKGV